MEKHMLLLRGLEGEPRSDFAQRILELARELAAHPEINAAKVVLTEPEIPRFSVIPFQKKQVAALSLYGEEMDGLNSWASAEGYSGHYRVKEAFPVAYQKNWPDGQVTPGICLLTLFRKKPDIDRATFLDRWHNGHTPLSLRLHPLWHYSRNVVEEKRNPESEPWDGIVDEHFRDRRALLNVYRFFGNSPLFPWHMWEVYKDVKGFLDYPSTETYLAQEYVLKS